MHKVFIYIVLTLFLAVSVSGCAGVKAPVSGFLVTNVSSPVTATSNTVSGNLKML